MLKKPQDEPHHPHHPPHPNQPPQPERPKSPEPPLNGQQQAQTEQTRRSLAIEVTDEIIKRFCYYNGGFELAMPIIRTQFKRLDIDHENPTVDGIHRLIDRLSEITEYQMGPDIAKEEHRFFREQLKKLKPTTQKS